MKAQATKVIAFTAIVMLLVVGCGTSASQSGTFPTGSRFRATDPFHTGGSFSPIFNPMALSP